MLRTMLCVAMLALASPTLAIEGIETGKAPPAFALQNLMGRTVSLEDYRGHTTAVLFWSTWSPRSAEMLADFRRHHERYESDGFRVLAVNADHETLNRQERATIERYVTAMDLPFPVLLDDGLETYAAYGIEALPSAVILDADGTVFSYLSGYPLFTYREELRDSFLTAMGRLETVPEEPEVAAVLPEAAEDKAACAIPRSRFCMMSAEREGGEGDPAIMAVRLALCRGDVAEAQRMLRGLGSEQRAKDELRFALAHLLLLKGKNGAAELLFTDLAGDAEESWGSWGLGLVALAEGRTGDALHHMEQAAGTGQANAEAETAVLNYLLEYWSEGKAAPEEKAFLGLFTSLSPVRNCYGELDTRS